ncbi:RNA-binding domain-containing protein [Segatella copri]|uniref:DNA binding domain-containing protein n=1 Tax=Segatella copri TaxID=165179 RepID=A0AAW5I0S8_9BACT|nr:RNA-binding domain-containing protein [Segatella copri]MCF0066498.1 putative DNA binding domain-containing protein [Segatella copri]MCP9457984.1 putative DNA binding domain-containing protein [Segatella copri]MCP9500501.1 putative DNA binding domain-containing protein [Segatella copri]MCP9503634.1 putative DNA binding domain-containing protein [Segatella copri]MCP9506591.1 putative DNA binding domain-containing protein [Segatella copri]
MMDDILKQINAGEVSGVQFKERILDKYDIACELVAFSNSHGGKLVVGIKDKTGETNALSYSEVQETTNLLSDIASENVVPSILIKIDTVEVEDGNLVVATVKEGLNKPYHDNKGIVWVKNGADKRKVFDNAELAEMMTDCGSFAPDEAGVRDATVNDLDATTIKQFLGNRFDRVLENKGLTGDAFNEASLDMICSAIAKGHDCEKILRNLRFIRPDGSLTVAAMLLFGKYTQRWLPMMTAKCICFAGNSVGSKVFRDKVNDADMEGNLLHQYDTIMDFFTRNLHNVQVGEEFNSMGKLEIPYTSLVEFTVNSLVHRSLNMKAPVRIFIFDNRVEIHSPGALPNGLTIDDIKAGTSMPRNMFLFNNAIYLLPYTGVGSGITRALDEDINVTFMNNDKAQEFVITVWREESNQVEDHNTGLRHSDTDLDTDHDTFAEDHDTQLRHSDTDLDTDHDTFAENHDTIHSYHDTKRVPLTNKQKDIVNFCSVPRTSREILERAGVVYHTKNIAKYITSLVAAGYLQMTNPDNPTASNQKYKKVTIK